LVCVPDPDNVRKANEREEKERGLVELLVGLRLGKGKRKGKERCLN
jgi:hypothetical protein